MRPSPPPVASRGEDKGGRCTECGVELDAVLSKEDDSRKGRLREADADAEAEEEEEGGGGSQEGEVDDELTDIREAVGEMP